MDSDAGNNRGREGGRRGGGITVDGSGSVVVEPDIASLSATIRWQADRLEDARSTVASKATAARDHLLVAGVEQADLQTSRLSVHTIRHHVERPAQDSGSRANVTEFVVATTLTAVFRRDLTQAESAVDGLFAVVGEGLELHDLTFDCSDRSAARIEARRLAFQDAQAKATQLAELADATLGPVRSIRDGAPTHRPGPPGLARRAMMAPEASIPIEGGSLVEEVDLHIRWTLNHSDTT